jgi:hypothetical protein
MPRRPAKVAQADIARAIRAAKEAGASAVTGDADGIIRIALTSSAAPSSPQMVSTRNGRHQNRCSAS